MIRLLHGDCGELLKTLDTHSVDAIVTDPPAEDVVDGLTTMMASGVRFAIVGVANPMILAFAAQHGLYVTSLGEQHHHNCIVITNYEPPLWIAAAAGDQSANRADFLCVVNA